MAGGGARDGDEFVSLRMLDAAQLHVDTIRVHASREPRTYIYIFSGGEEETSDHHISSLKHT